jgi:hypothetical protein
MTENEVNVTPAVCQYIGCNEQYTHAVIQTYADGSQYAWAFYCEEHAPEMLAFHLRMAEPGADMRLVETVMPDLYETIYKPVGNRRIGPIEIS